jgi:hypothetical protein
MLIYYEVVNKRNNFCIFIIHFTIAETLKRK